MGETARGTLASMTGYARASGQVGRATWLWELKSVNAKGLELRLRVPAGFDAVEVAARARIGARLRRGTVHASLSVQRAKLEQTVTVDRARLAALVAAVAAVPLPPGIAPATLDGLLTLPGVVDVSERTEAGDDGGDLDAALLAGLDIAVDDLCAMRVEEGRAVGRVLGERLVAVVRLTAQAEAAPGRAPDMIRDRLARRIHEIAGAVPELDPARLHAEAVLLAAKSDVREELDRLAMHAAAASDLLAGGGAVGRRLDFLAQELGREAGTLCAKSGDAGLTAAGLALRTEIEQFREQVQNLE